MQEHVGAKLSLLEHPRWKSIPAGTPGAVFQPDGASSRVSGPATFHDSYSFFATFSAPDRNSWLMQEVTRRGFPGASTLPRLSLAPQPDLASALRRAAADHGEHEWRIGNANPNGPDCYAEFMVAELSGKVLPQ